MRDELVPAEPTHAWAALIRIGGIAPLITLGIYFGQTLVIMLGDSYPLNVLDWIMLYRQDRLLCLVYINAFDVFSISILGLMYLALWKTLARSGESLSAVAAYFALLGVPVFVIPRAVALSALPVFDGYIPSMMIDVVPAVEIVIGRFIEAVSIATPLTLGFFFLAVSGLLFSIVMLRSTLFGKPVAYLGIFAAVTTFAVDIINFLEPSAGGALLIAGSLPWLLWWLMVGRTLLVLADKATRSEKAVGEPGI